MGFNLAFKGLMHSTVKLIYGFFHHHHHHWLESPWWALAFLRSFAHSSVEDDLLPILNL
jgi:hypothetical protein